ncbi:MAG: hypothetical protein J0M09_05665 [Xanthomonadales bacterium]|nr:hypothetical protein [Xanthomonadales bacterium]
MSYDISKLVRFFSIKDEPFGWFVPIVIAFGVWYASMLSVLTTGTGILGEKVKNHQEAAEMIQLFARDLLESNGHGLDRRIVSVSTMNDGIVEQRITVRVVDGQNTYKLRPWAALIIPSFCFIIVGMITVGVLGYDRGAQPPWLDRSITFFSLAAILVYSIPRLL